MRRTRFPFWQFSLRTYRAAGVAEACLALQDDCGADVNLLLYCCWMAARGRRLTKRSLRSAITAVSGWQGEVVRPLRQARRALKKGRRAVARVWSESLRECIGAAELDAEYVEQRILAGHAAPGSRPTGRREPRAVATANLESYFELLRAAIGPRQSRHLGTLTDDRLFRHRAPSPRSASPRDRRAPTSRARKALPPFRD